jgi:predicted permease
MLAHLFSDLRNAVRRLATTPGFTAAAVITIALGVGINTGIYSVLNAIALRDLPAPQADELVTIHQVVEGDESRHSEGGPSMFTAAEYATYRDRAETLTGLLGYSMQMGMRLGDEVTQERTGTFVTCNYFDVLRQPPALGRGFTAQDCERGAPATAVLSHEIWTNAFGADPGIVGRTIVLNRQSVTVVGVAPEGVRGLGFLSVGYFLSVASQPVLMESLNWLDDERVAWLRLIGRKAENASVAAVRAELGVVAAEIDRQRPSRDTTLAIDRARRFSEPEMQPIVLAAGGIVMAAFGLVLLIACANVANLLLARATGRAREIAVRLSLGASRARVVRLLLAESLLIGAAGGALGSLLAAWSFQGIVLVVLSALPFDLPEILLDTSPDSSVLAFAIVVSVATGVLCGLAPALRAARADLQTAMKVDPLLSSRRTGGRLQATLVGTQVAVCMVLMVAAGLLLRGLQATQEVDPGFEFENVAVASFAWSESYDASQTAAVHRRLVERIGAMPGIEGVAQVRVVPLATVISTTEARLPDQAEPFVAEVNTVSPSYFSLLGIPLVQGRTFTEAELADGSTAVIVTEATARRVWPQRDPIGETLVLSPRDVRTGARLPDRTLEVVGVAKDAQVASIGQIPEAYLYFPSVPQSQPLLKLLAKGRGDFAATAAAVRSAIAEIDPRAVANIDPLEANVDVWRTLSGFVSTLSVSLGALALVLASVGVYGVVAYAVGRRAREIGIRVALGASARSVIGLMLRRTMRPVVVGAVVGLAAAVAASQVLSSVLFGVSPVDPAALLSAALVVAGVAFAAGALPARRAARVDPSQTLHCE